jgi:hypothetical protein
MDQEIQQYILWFCRDYMRPSEWRALRRFGLTGNGEQSMRAAALKEAGLEASYGFQDPEVNTLVALGKENAEEKIAQRIYDQHSDAIMNFCPQCGQLARTPKAKQCRFCGFDWH